jgi:hypothetical protein
MYTIQNLKKGEFGSFLCVIYNEMVPLDYLYLVLTSTFLSFFYILILLDISHSVKAERGDIKNIRTRYQWLTPVILATQEADVRRIMVQS